MVPYLLIPIGFVLLILSADILVVGASSLARRLRVSDLAIGLTVVAFGTSTPELCVNMLAALQGKTDLALANVVGSNIANILLILGLAACLAPLPATQGTVWKEIPFSLLAALVLGTMINDRLLGGGDNLLTRGDGLVLLSFFIIFLYYTKSIAIEVEGVAQHAANTSGLAGASLRIAGGLLGLIFGGWLIVENASRLAASWGVDEALVGLTVVAVGTSLPELATSVVAAYRGNADIAVGNVVGSNIFNIFLILGTTAVIQPVSFDARGNLEILTLVTASSLLFLTMFTGRKRSLDRWEGLLFVLLYLGFIGLKIYLF